MKASGSEFCVECVGAWSFMAASGIILDGPVLKLREVSGHGEVTLSVQWFFHLPGSPRGSGFFPTSQKILTKAQERLCFHLWEQMEEFQSQDHTLATQRLPAC